MSGSGHGLKTAVFGHAVQKSSPTAAMRYHQHIVYVGCSIMLF